MNKKEISHTPGPWTIRGDRDGFRIETSAIWIGSTSRHPYEETRANANMVAAAPIMLQALEVVLAAMDSGEYRGVYGIVTAAIKEAKGEA